MSTYYMLWSASPAEGFSALISHESDDPFRSWWSGERFADAPPTPLEATVNMRSQSVLLEMWDTPIPLMTKRLHHLLVSAGVANIDVYPALLSDPKSGRVYDHYVAFNLIGVIAAADLSQSNYKMPDGPLVSVDFDSLTIDPHKARGAKMFRLAESVNGIVVHESIKNLVESAKMETLVFSEPKNWAG